MAEPADASVSKTDEGNLVGVRLPLSAPTRSEVKLRLIRPRRGRSQCFPAPDMTGKPTGNPDALAHLNAEVRQMARRAKGEGAVYLRGDRRWEAQLRLGVGRRKSVYGRTRRGVLGKLREARWSLKRGLPVSSRKLTLAAFLEGWLEVVKGRVRASTYESYELNARRVSAELGEVPLQSLSPGLIQASYQHLLRRGLKSAQAGLAAANRGLGPVDNVQLGEHVRDVVLDSLQRDAEVRRHLLVGHPTRDEVHHLSLAGRQLRKRSGPPHRGAGAEERRQSLRHRRAEDRVAAHDGRDGSGNVVRLGVLQQVAAGARAYGSEHGIRFLVHGQDQHPRRWAHLEKGPRRLDPVHLRHSDVHQDHIGRQLPGQLNGLLTG